MGREGGGGGGGDPGDFPGNSPGNSPKALRSIARFLVTSQSHKSYAIRHNEV